VNGADGVRPADWRAGCPVLVPTAHALGNVAVIRSLGRAGYPVHACSSRPDALGFRSRFARTGIVHPPFGDAAFLPWLREYVRTRGIRAIVPSDELILAIRPAFAEFAQLLPVGLAEAALYAGLSKTSVFRRLVHDGDVAPGEHMPPTLLVDGRHELPSVSQLRGLGSPLYLKVDAAHSTFGEGSRVVIAPDAQAARERLAALLPRFREALVQGYVPGRGVGAFFLIWRGRVLAEFMHLRLHEVPHTGGASSLRCSWRHEAIRADALAKLRRLGWEGVAMMEYRWDPLSDRFHFIEMNGRFWGSLHLALYAGVDFPRLLLDAFFDGPIDPVVSPARQVRCRCTFPMEVQYVWSRLKDRSLNPLARVWSVVEFMLLSCDPRVRSDLLFPGDRGLYWESLRRFATSLF
jgi:predicted ATP-grasp superfamily ATP-dependent carboligase